jgi:predicted component of type VI protein secretion system
MSKPTQMIDLRDIVVQPNRMRQLRPEVVDEVAALAGIVLRRSAS